MRSHWGSKIFDQIPEVFAGGGSGSFGAWATLSRSSTGLGWSRGSRGLGWCIVHPDICWSWSYHVTMSDLSDWKRRFLVVEYTNAMWHGPLSVVNVAHLRACHIATCVWKTPILHAPHHGSNRFDPLRRGHLMTSGYLLAVANACSLYCAAWAFAERPALCQSSASHHTETFNMFRHLALSTVLIQSPKLVYHGTIYSLYNPQWLQAFAQFFKITIIHVQSSRN